MPRSASHPVAEARRLIGLAWPVMLTSLNWTLLHLIDVAVVGHAGTDQLGALAAARSILYVIMVAGMAGLSGVLVFVSQADGAGRPEESGDTLRAGLLCALLFGCAAMAVLLLFAEPLILGVGVSPALAPAGARVGHVMALAFPAQFTAAAASYFLEGASQPRRVTIANLAMLPINAVLAWALADGRLGAPALGAVGAALATTITSWLGLGMIAFACWTLPDAEARQVRDLSRAAWRRAARGLPAIARFGVVPAFSAGLELFGFAILIALSTRLGAVTAGAFQAVFSLHNLTFSIGLGMGSAAGVRVGNAVGAGEAQEAPARTTLAMLIGVVLVAMLATAYFFFAPSIVAIFSGDPAVTAEGAVLLAALAVFIPFDAVQIVYLYALRSLGDQVAAGINGIIAYFVVTGGLGWLLVAGGFGPKALVLAAGIGMIAAALLQSGRFLIVTRRVSAPLSPRSSG